MVEISKIQGKVDHYKTFKKCALATPTTTTQTTTPTTTTETTSTPETTTIL